MQIISNGERMLALTPHFTIEWYIGSHTANVKGSGGDIDCFTFAWHKNKASMLDFTTSLLNWLAED
jgi:hypothetical protein